jgi:hypothetical protein
MAKTVKHPIFKIAAAVTRRREAISRGGAEYSVMLAKTSLSGHYCIFCIAQRICLRKRQGLFLIMTYLFADNCAKEKTEFQTALKDVSEIPYIEQGVI